MGRFDLEELPPALAEHVPAKARLGFPHQGMTSHVAFAEQKGRVVVVKRCAHPVYLDWLRREHLVLRALAGSGLPVPESIGYAGVATSRKIAGWLVMSRLRGSPFMCAAVQPSPARRKTMFRRLGELVRRLHASPVPQSLRRSEPWIALKVDEARKNLSWCDGTAAGLAELERSQPPLARDTLIHGDLALDNVLIDEQGKLGLVDWAGGGPGDPRHDIALALQTKPEFELSAGALDAFYAGYGGVAVDADVRDWFVRLYDFF